VEDPGCGGGGETLRGVRDVHGVVQALQGEARTFPWGNGLGWENMRKIWEKCWDFREKIGIYGF
jgi:hypothetical protein